MKDFEGYREAVGSRGLQGSVWRRGCRAGDLCSELGRLGETSGVLEGSRIEVRERGPRPENWIWKMAVGMPRGPWIREGVCGGQGERTPGRDRPLPQAPRR